MENVSYNFNALSFDVFIVLIIILKTKFNYQYYWSNLKPEILTILQLLHDMKVLSFHTNEWIDLKPFLCMHSIIDKMRNRRKYETYKMKNSARNLNLMNKIKPYHWITKDLKMKQEKMF
jgi:hypothetical protein